tara:strand:- start:98 stop:1054 length:957 start_codon:yes stop_codon:yes gene_type:complete
MKKENVSKEDDLSLDYDKDFVVDKDYRASLPDMQNASVKAIRGAHVPISRVGSSNFKLPLKFKTPTGETMTLETSISAAVSVGGESKGINMSRIVRTVYEYQYEVMSISSLPTIVDALAKALNSDHVWIKLNFSYPIIQKSLRSGLEGYQYYTCAFEGILDKGQPLKQIFYFDYVYSSSCPCSSELSKHAREERNIYSIPHSQRSTARVKVQVADNTELFVEDLLSLCVKGIPTETQVMVRREDEQAFAELNGANLIFVEDAIRLLFRELDADKRIVDFEIACAHLESLHSHDAVSVTAKGIPGGFNGTFTDFQSLVR